jgi:hypothetical protein
VELNLSLTHSFHISLMALLAGCNSCGMPEEQANIYRQRAAECEALARHYENTFLGKYLLKLGQAMAATGGPN